MKITRDLFLDEWVWINYRKIYEEYSIGIFKDYTGKKYLIMHPWELRKTCSEFVNTIFGRVRFDNLCVRKEPEKFKEIVNNTLVTKFMPREFCISGKFKGKYQNSTSNYYDKVFGESGL